MNLSYGKCSWLIYEDMPGIKIDLVRYDGMGWAHTYETIVLQRCKLKQFKINRKGFISRWTVWCMSFY